MKFPRMKNTIISQILLYLPVPLLAAGGICLSFIIEKHTNAPRILWIIPFFAGLIFPLIYLFKNLPLLLFSDYIFFSIRAWQRDRMVFITDYNGSNCEDIRKRILSRCLKFGKTCTYNDARYTPDVFIHRRSASNTAFYSCISRYVIVFSVDELNDKLFDSIITSARRALKRHFLDDYTRFKNDSRDLHPALCAAVIILADKINCDISETARREVSSEFGCILPCVVDCSLARYYFNARDEFYILGSAGKPEKNYAIDIIKKVVFSGKLPSGHTENLPDDDPLNGKEITLWEYISSSRNAVREADKEFDSELKSAADTLSDGEVMLGKRAVYCKLCGQLAAMAYSSSDESDSQKLDLSLPTFWRWPKKQRISKRDADDICRLVEKALREEGYEIHIDYVVNE